MKPDLIIETGIAHGGSLILSASMLAAGVGAKPSKRAPAWIPKPSVVFGVDIDIRAHNRAAIEAHPMAVGSTMIEGSSIADKIIEQVIRIAAGLFSASWSASTATTPTPMCWPNWRPMRRYDQRGQLLRRVRHGGRGSAGGHVPDRPWGPGNNPKTAVQEFLKTNPEFEIDREHRQQAPDNRRTGRIFEAREVSRLRARTSSPTCWGKGGV